MAHRHSFSHTDTISPWRTMNRGHSSTRLDISRTQPIDSRRRKAETHHLYAMDHPVNTAHRIRGQDLLNLIIPVDKPWSEIGITVYRVGVGMYHSSLVVDDLEWHYWEGYGVEPILRYFDDTQDAFVSVDHVPFVTYVPIDTVMISPRAIAEICEELGASEFSQFTYDILRCNCNHFTYAMLQRLGLVSKMPSWINWLASTADAVCTRLPFVRHWIDSLLNRRTVINRDTPNDLANPSDPKTFLRRASLDASNGNNFGPPRSLVSTGNRPTVLHVSAEAAAQARYLPSGWTSKRYPPQKILSDEKDEEKHGNDNTDSTSVSAQQSPTLSMGSTSGACSFGDESTNGSPRVPLLSYCTPPCHSPLISSVPSLNWESPPQTYRCTTQYAAHSFFLKAPTSAVRRRILPQMSDTVAPLSLCRKRFTVKGAAIAQSPNCNTKRCHYY